MKIVRSRILPFGRFAAINLMGILFVRPGVKLTAVLVNHERIHSRQMLELAVLPFYLLYLLEWLVRLALPGNAYRNVSFEREAYAHDHDLDYLKHRPHYAWLREMRREKQQTDNK